MNSKITVQKLRKEMPPMEVATKYYGILSVVNNLNLTEKEIKLLAHTAIKGTISTVSSKEEFVKAYGSSVATVNNFVSKLRKRKLLVKSHGKIRVNPKIALDFTSSDCILYITLNNNEYKQDN